MTNFPQCVCELFTKNKKNRTPLATNTQKTKKFQKTLTKATQHFLLFRRLQHIGKRQEEEAEEFSGARKRGRYALTPMLWQNAKVAQIQIQIQILFSPAWKARTQTRTGRGRFSLFVECRFVSFLCDFKHSSVSKLSSTPTHGHAADPADTHTHARKRLSKGMTFFRSRCRSRCRRRRSSLAVLHFLDNSVEKESAAAALS